MNAAQENSGKKKIDTIRTLEHHIRMLAKHHKGTSVFLSQSTGEENGSHNNGLLLGLLLTTSGGGFACV